MQRSIHIDETTPKAVIRYMVMERDHYTCQDCGITQKELPPHLPLHLHRLRPGRKGGSYTLKNCITLCQPCHSRKLKQRFKQGRVSNHLTTIRCTGCDQLFQGTNNRRILQRWYGHYVECVKQ